MISSNSQSARTAVQDLVVLTVLIGLLFGIMLGNRPLSVPDEGRYVEIAREMASTGDYVTPRLNGVKYFEKPVLFYWLEAFSIRLFGLGEYTLRLLPALFALAGCLMVYAAGRRIYGRTAGLVAAAVLATSVLYYSLSRLVILDMAVSVFLSASLLSFLTGIRQPPGLTRRLLFWGFYLCAALAVLTKGLIGIFIPGMVVGAWILILGEWRVLTKIYLPSGLVLFLIVAVPWHLLVGRANPEFFNFYFIHEHFQRYLTRVHNRFEPAWFFVPVLLGGLVPWSPFLVQAVTYSTPSTWADRHEHRDALFLMLWAGLVFLFFSASDSKLIPYILPVFPPIAILIGRYLAEAWKSGNVPGLSPGMVAVCLTSLSIAFTLFIAPHVRPGVDDPALHARLYLLTGILTAGAGATWLLWRTKGFRWALGSIVAAAALFLITGNSMGAHATGQSVKELAVLLKPRLAASDEVASFFAYYQDLPVYLERRITVVEWQGELAFGTKAENTSDWMVDRETFWKRWYGPNRMYLFTKRQVWQAMQIHGYKHLNVLAGTPDTVLLTNKEAIQ